jgi:Na+/melibiose symporter-like transporter
MFGAINGFCQKFALALTSLIGGFLLRLAGLNPNTADAGVSASTASTLKLLTIGIQASGFLIAILVFLFYSITRERAAQTRRQLEERHRQWRQLQEEPADTICMTHS